MIKNTGKPRLSGHPGITVQWQIHLSLFQHESPEEHDEIRTNSRTSIPCFDYSVFSPILVNSSISATMAFMASSVPGKWLMIPITPCVVSVDT